MLWAWDKRATRDINVSSEADQETGEKGNTMKTTKELPKLQGGRLVKTAVLTMVMALFLTLFGEGFAIVSRADSAGRVTAAGGAKVRSSASASADVLTSYPQNTEISIRSQIQASDGYVWYEIWVTGDTLGYIRSDLVEITDGTTPTSSTQVTPTATQTASPGDDLAPAEVTAVNPISAIVTGSSGTGVRIRSNASTRSKIVTQVQNNLALTVTGQAASLDNDGKTWYQVNFNSDGTEVSGFIRSDYVQLSGELTPYTEPTESPVPEEPVTSPEEAPPVEEPEKEYDTYLMDDVWYVKLPNGNAYNLVDLLKINEETFPALAKKVKTQQVVIVILVFLLVAAAGGVGFLIFKIRDMMDSQYFNQVEAETLRRRNEQRGQGGRPASSGQRPGTATSQSRRPGGAPQGQRPSGAPQGQRPSGTSQGQGQRPSGAPQGQRPGGAPQGQRPSGAPQSQRPGTAPQGQRPSGTTQGGGKPQSKNFMADDDEFEFEFLNYDGEDEK